MSGFMCHQLSSFLQFYTPYYSFNVYLLFIYLLYLILINHPEYNAVIVMAIAIGHRYTRVTASIHIALSNKHHLSPFVRQQMV